ncbi:hypothetical protein BCIN_06g05370 [Botrytis cinerea B05.10]|uniref:Uncharacterized protein n=2 Tax=Botryotinia fuckeliana TaxID=40559 RepID=A0A384JKM1_BOTFB|nr:hypothetical protein BCIN_06g05370 [Botrytis cinerea B05.10]ATZ51103.1 hypothetical protein BCIN_06g05370 [Botrytis cinerea B05.10]EMR87574.1 hypothetical protein BcDW1_3747 [Botrytis cinerea BcDW1]
MRHQLLIAFVAPAALVAASVLKSRGECQQGYTLCSPAGANTATTPQIGDSDFVNLFQDIVLSSLPASKRSLSSSSEHSVEKRDSPSLCCVSSLTCLTMHSLNIPFCYDQFTTNYYLPDDSYGTVVGGSYSSSSGATANLESGDYTEKDGTTGNIYNGNSAAKPNTATLPMPSQFTASGVGSAIPASALGGVTVTYTTTLPASTIPATTIPATTVSESISQQTISVSTTITSSVGGNKIVSTEVHIGTTETTILGTTRSASTRAASTVSEIVATVTTVVASDSASALSASATASATGNSGVGRPAVEVGVAGIMGMVGLVALVL